MGVFPILLALLAANALFVLLEFALVRVRASRIEVLARRGSARALQVQDALSHLDMYLAAIQVGITIVALTLGSLGEPALTHWLGGLLSKLPVEVPPQLLHGLSYAMALSALAFAHTVFGELLPRYIGIQKAELVSLWGVAPLRVFAMLFRYPIAFMHFCSTSILKLFGFKISSEPESIVSEEEMRILLGDTQERGSLPLERLLLLENLFDFGKALAGEVMVPLEKVAYLSLKRPWGENLDLIRARRFSRYPLCEDGPPNFLGTVHVKDLVLRAEEGKAVDLRRIKRDIVTVAESEPLERLLKVFPDKGIHMAMVSNAKGEITGLLTLEDIVEELVGEVHDEFDLPSAWSMMDVVVPSAVAVGLLATDREGAIAQLLSRLKAAFPELDEPEAYKAVWSREIKFSSAVGRGVAVPHARFANLSRPLVAVGRFAKPVPFPGPDNLPVRLVFLILTPAASPIIQLKILARIASLATNENLRRKLLRAKTSESMLDILRTADTMLAA